MSSGVFKDYAGRGLDAALPAPATLSIPAGTSAYYYATDTNKLYMLNAAGTAWVIANPAGGGGGGTGLIAEVVTAASQANINFAAIPSTYRNLRLTINGRSTFADFDVGVLIRFNGDVGNNYSQAQMFDNGSPFNSAGQSSFRGPQIAAASGAANVFDFLQVDIGNYKSTTQNKAMQGQGINNTNSSPFHRLLQYTGRWNSAAAITSIDLFLSAGNWVDGSVVGLYGY